MISRRIFLQALTAAGVLPQVSSPALMPLTMQLDWRLNAQFAGLCVAQAHGNYRRQGLVVTLKPATPAMDVVQTVVAQPYTVGCAEESLILAAQAKGVPIVAIAAMLQASPLSLMSLPTVPLNDLQQLKGKRIGVHRDGRHALEFVLAQHGISPKPEIIEIPYTAKYQRLLDGELDAVQCYALDEPVEFARRLGDTPEILTFSDYGFDAYSQVIFAPIQLVLEHSQRLHGFLAATFAGWTWAIDHPTQTANLLVKDYVPSDYQDVAYQTQSLDIIANYVRSAHAPIGQLSLKRWQHSAQQLVQAGLIDTLPSLAFSVDPSLWP